MSDVGLHILRSGRESFIFQGHFESFCLHDLVITFCDRAQRKVTVLRYSAFWDTHVGSPGLRDTAYIGQGSLLPGGSWLLCQIWDVDPFLQWTYKGCVGALRAMVNSNINVCLRWEVVPRIWEIIICGDVVQQEQIGRGLCLNNNECKVLVHASLNDGLKLGLERCTNASAVCLHSSTTELRDLGSGESSPWIEQINPIPTQSPSVNSMRSLVSVHSQTTHCNLRTFCKCIHRNPRVT